MNGTSRFNELRFLLIIGLLVMSILTSIGQTRESDFNFNWKFSLDEHEQAYKADFDDNAWSTLNLPHDWSVEFPFDTTNLEGCTGYLPGGIGWYRKHFHTNAGVDEKVYILFDGVYNNSEYWINGNKLGERPYGYVPFYFDLTPHLNSTGTNLIAVRVDRTRTADSRWYSGSGIYRNVKLIQTNKLHIPVWGVFVTTPEVSSEQARVNISISVQNDYATEETFDLITQIQGIDGEIVGEMITENIIAGAGVSEYQQSTLLANPKLWNLDNPNRYHAITRIVRNGEEVDQILTPFGIRSFQFDADKGFFLNRENMKIKGVCLHHDAGQVGAAVPKAVWKRRFEILKGMGCNAIRISHNPGSEEFLDLCDEMGILVQDEFFDEWYYPKDKRLNCWEQHDDYHSRGYAEHFGTWAERDLKNIMLAHRNHPSIIQWSIGNEIEWTYPSNRFATGFFDNMNWDGNYFWSPPPYTPEQIKEEYQKLEYQEYPIEETAKTLAAWTREMDTTRPVIANCILPSTSFVTGYANELDIVGFSYRRVMYDYAKERYPDKVIMGTENLPQWHEWKAVMERSFVSGLFIWTGFDHMGEVNDSWPYKTSPVGLIDQTGYPNTGYHMYKSLWNNEPHIHIYTQLTDSMDYLDAPGGYVLNETPDAWDELTWYSPIRNEHWNYSKGDEVLVEIISNCEEVELFMNDKSLGTKNLSDFPDRKYKWFVPYQEGVISAIGMKESEFATSAIQTGMEPVTMQAFCDKTNLSADGYDAAHIEVQLMDVNGNPVRHINRKIQFEITGGLKNLGVDNGCRTSVQSYKSDDIVTHNGRAMLIVQSGLIKGAATVRVKSGGLPDKEIEITLN